MWARIINTILGIWMMVAPSALDYGEREANNAYIFGANITTVAIIAMAESVRNVRWLNFLMGLWLIMAPWVLNFEKSEAIINDTIVGIVVAGLSMVKGKIKEKMGGGWLSLFQKNGEHGKAASR